MRTVRIATTALVILLILPVLYVLSCGPVAYLMQRDILSGEAAESYCVPMHAIRTSNATLECAIDSYWGWWLDLAFS